MTWYICDYSLRKENATHGRLQNGTYTICKAGENKKIPFCWVLTINKPQHIHCSTSMSSAKKKGWELINLNKGQGQCSYGINGYEVTRNNCGLKNAGIFAAIAITVLE